MEPYWLDIATLLIVGIVGGILASQVKKQNHLINNLQSYINIIDIDKIKKYADMRSEHDKLKLEIAVKKAAEILTKRMVNRLMKTTVEPRLKEYEQEISNGVDELMNLVFDVVVSHPKEERIGFIDEYLPINKQYILPQLKEYEKTEGTQDPG